MVEVNQHFRDQLLSPATGLYNTCTKTNSVAQHKPIGPVGGVHEKPHLVSDPTR